MVPPEYLKNKPEILPTDIVTAITNVDTRNAVLNTIAVENIKDPWLKYQQDLIAKREKILKQNKIFEATIKKHNKEVAIKIYIAQNNVTIPSINKGFLPENSLILENKQKILLLMLITAIFASFCSTFLIQIQILFFSAVTLCISKFE